LNHEDSKYSKKIHALKAQNIFFFECFESSWFK